MDVASSIRRIRTDRFHTRKALAQKAGIDLRHLIAVEDGREEATLDDIEAISRAFRLDPSDWIR